MEKFLIFCWIQLKFRFWLYKKNVEPLHESFSSKKTSNQKVVAKKPLTNLYEMNSKGFLTTQSWNLKCVLWVAIKMVRMWKWIGLIAKWGLKLVCFVRKLNCKRIKHDRATLWNQHNWISTQIYFHYWYIDLTSALSQGSIETLNGIHRRRSRFRVERFYVLLLCTVDDV